MNTKMNATGSSRKLLVALAVLAVAFVALAAVPAVSTNSDAAVQNVSSYDELIAAVGASDVSKVVLTSDIDVTGKAQIDINKDFELDLAGHTISKVQAQNLDGTSYKDSANRMRILYVHESCNVTISDSVGGGKLIGKTFDGNLPAYDSASGDQTLTIGGGDDESKMSVLTLNNVTIESDLYGIGVFAYGKVVANSVTIRTVHASTLGLNGMSINGSKGSDVTINGGSYTSADAPAFYWSNTKTLSITDATISGAAALDIRAGSAVLKNVSIVMDTKASNEVGTDGPARFNVGIGVYTNSTTSYGDPEVTLQNVTFKTANGVTADAEIYYGHLALPSKNTYTFTEMIKAADTAAENHTAMLTVNDVSGNVKTEFTATENNGTRLLLSIDGSTIIGDSKLDNVEIAGDITIDSGASLVIETGSDLTINEGSTLTVAGKISGNVVNNGEIVTKIGADITSAGITGTGTVVADRDVSEMKEAYLGGEVVGATFEADQKVIVDKKTNIVSGDLTIKGVLIVNEGVTLTISAGAHLKILNNADVRILGTLVVEEADDDAGANQGTLAVKSGTIRIFGIADIRGDASIDNLGTLSILQGSDVSVSGTITSTGKVVIADSATLTVAGISSVALYEVSAGGTIVFDSDVVSGDNTILLKGMSVVKIDSIVLGDGRTLTIEDEGTYHFDDASETTSTFEGNNSITLEAAVSGIDAESQKPVLGQVGAVFSGLIVVSSTVKVDDITGDGYAMKAVLTIEGDLAVDGIYYPTGVDDATEAEVTATIDMDIDAASEAVLENVTVGEGITAFVLGASVVEGDIVVDGKLVNSGSMTVTGSINAPGASEDKDAYFANDATLTVEGDGTVTTGYKLAGTINAAYYTVGKASAENHFYVTVDAAIAAAAAGTTKSIEVLGSQTVTATAELPAGVTMTISGKLAVGTDDDAGADVVLTIASGATVNCKGTPVKESETEKATLTVYGTLKAEKKTDINSKLREAIASDVRSEEMKDGKVVGKGWAEWTNIYTALENAQAGETVTLQRSIPLRSVAVPADVTLDVNGKTLTVPQKVTLTVNGTLDLTNDESNVVLVDPTMDGETVKVAGGAIVIEGYVAYLGAEVPVTGGNTIPGAYYSVTASGRTTNYLTSYLNGIADANKADSDDDEEDIHCVDFVGKDGKVELGDVAITGNEDELVVIHIKNAALVAGNVTMTNTAIVLGDVPTTTDDDEPTGPSVSASYAIKGTFTNGNGTVVIDALSSRYVIGSGVLEEVQTFAFYGAFSDFENADSFITIEGTVYAVDKLVIAVDKLSVVGDLILGVFVDDESEDAVVSVGNATVAAVVSVTGSVTIREAFTLTVNGPLDVDGAVMIENGKLFANGVTTVNGSIDATAVDEAYTATATFKILYVGIDKDAAKYVKPASGSTGSDASATTGADASVKGDITVSDYAVLGAGVVAPASFSEYKSTAFSMGSDIDAYMTVFTQTTGIAINGFSTSQSEALFDGWYYGVDGKATKVVDSDSIGTHGSVYAKFVTEIYKVTINADAGVAYITIDGKLMNNDGRTFTISGLTAGNHRIAISAVSGYDTSKTALYFPDGKAVGSLDINLANGVASFDKNGKVVYADVVYQLYGSEVATPDTPEPTPIIIKDDKDTSLTDTLLIVLVVLIVIMAILVALRMMRS